MPELWLRKVFPVVVNVNSNVPEKKVKMILSKSELSLLPEDSTYICKRNMVSCYIIRQSERVFNQLCYASFVMKYELLTKQLENDSQSNELSDEVIKENNTVNNNNSYPKRITLSTGEKLVHRKIEFVLRYDFPNSIKILKRMRIIRFLCFIPFAVKNNLKQENHSHIVQNY